MTTTPTTAPTTAPTTDRAPLGTGSIPPAVERLVRAVQADNKPVAGFTSSI